MISPSLQKAMLLAFASVVLLFLGGRDPLGGEPHISLLYSLLSSIVGLLAVLVVLRSHEHMSFRYILAVALLLRVTAALAWPLLEDDYFRYLWDGRQVAITFSPWATPPAAWFGDSTLEDHWQWILSNINYPELPTIYGPVLQYVFWLGYMISPGSLGALQGLNIVVDLLILVSLYYSAVPSRWLMAYAVHPLVLKEAIANVHPDLILGLALILCVRAWQSQRPVLVGLLLGLALGTKVSALVAIPFFLVVPFVFSSYTVRFKWGATVLFSCVTTVAMLYIPLLGGGSELLSLQVFANTWRFNPLGFSLIEMVVPNGAERYVAAAVIMSAIFVVWFKWVKNHNRALPPVDIALFILIFFSPVVNGWYWLWLLPIALLYRRNWLLLFVIFSVLGYCTLGNMFSGETADAFVVPGIITVLQLLILMALLVLSLNLNRYRKMSNKIRNKIRVSQSIKAQG